MPPENVTRQANRSSDAFSARASRSGPTLSVDHNQIAATPIAVPNKHQYKTGRATNDNVIAIESWLPGGMVFEPSVAFPSAAVALLVMTPLLLGMGLGALDLVVS